MAVDPVILASASKHQISGDDMLHAYRNPVRVFNLGDLMPRSIQDILDHANELAERFENYQPESGDERPVEEYLLERAALARALSERQIVEAVATARSWQRIGELLGTSAQAAQQRYGNVIATN